MSTKCSECGAFLTSKSVDKVWQNVDKCEQIVVSRQCSQSVVLFARNAHH